METITTTKPKTTVEKLRSVYLEPRKNHPEGAFDLVKKLNQSELQNEFNGNYNAMIKAGYQSKEGKLRYSYQQFLLQHIRKH